MVGAPAVAPKPSTARERIDRVATLGRMGTVCVIENSSDWHLGGLRGWLTDAGLEPVVVRPHAGDPIPADTSGHTALLALGGGSGAAWTPELAALLRKAVADRVPTLAVCSSARVLATSFGGGVAAVDDFRPGPRFAARRDAAESDPLFGPAPMAMDVVWWRHQEITELPPEAVLLAASPHGVPEIFRIGDRAWGVQSHMELDGEMIRALGGDDDLVRRVDDIAEFLDATWRPVMERFAAVAAGRTGGTMLPLTEL